MKKKILIYAKDYDLSLINLIKNINYKTNEVDLYIEKKPKTKITKKIQVIEYKIYKNKLLNFFNKIKFKFTNSNKYDSSILYTPSSIIGNYIVRTASKNPILFLYKDYSKIYEQDFRNYFTKRNIYEFNNIIFATNESKDNFLKYYPSLIKKTHVINALIDYKDVEKKSKEIIEEKIKRTDLNMLLIEELDEQKNNILAKLKFTKDLIKEIPNLKLFIIGDGIDKLAYKSYIEDNHLQKNIILLGKKTNYYPYIKKCQYLIHTDSNNLQLPIISLLLKTQVISTINIQDDIISNDNVHCLSSIPNKIKEELKQILINKEKKKIKIDFEKTNQEKLEKLEEII